jgi:hypothetical protein
MDESIRLDDPTPVAVELVGIADDDEPKNEGASKKVRASIDKIIRDAETGNTRLVVSLPRLVDTSHAGAAVDLLLEKWDNYYLETLIVTGVRFTRGGMCSITTFIKMQDVAQTIQTLVLHDILGGALWEREDEDHFYDFCKTLQNAPNLESIDMSHNLIGPYVWDALGKQSKLKSLCLSDVELHDSSFRKLQSIFASGETLQDLTISNFTRTGMDACDALDGILESCRNLRSFSWENKYQSSANNSLHQDGYVPVIGLAQLSKNLFKSDFGSMHHLEITGGTIPVQNIGLFCDALEGFHKLQALKISDCGLNSETMQRIVTALRSARPPLSAIDFSHNHIDCVGTSWIAELSCLRAVTKNLRLLNLEYNKIGQKGALDIIERFASKSSGFQLQLQEGNHFDSSAVFLSLASSKHAAETELKDLRKDCLRLRAEKTDAQNNLRELLQAQSAMVQDMHDLSAKTKQLEEDKESLIKAFSVLGMVQHVQERDNMMTRLRILEEAVLGRGHIVNGNNGLSSTAPSPLRPERSDLSRQSSRTHIFDEARMSPSVSASTLPIVQPSFSGPSSPAHSVKSPNRPTTARNQLVRAASERWKSMLQTPKLSKTGQDEQTKRKQGIGRSKSSKSLAEFLSKSAPEMRQGDDSFSTDEHSMKTTPIAFLSDSSSALGGARRRMRQNAISSSRGPPLRNKSMSSAPPLDRTAQDASYTENNDSMVDSSRSRVSQDD